MYQNYNTAEVSFVLNFDFDIPYDHVARLISLFVDSIPVQIIKRSTATTGRPAFHPQMLLKMILFAYSRQVFSGRKMVEMNQENIPMKWLSRDTSVSYKTLNNFRSSDDVADLIKTAFVYFTLLLADNDMLQDEALFVDGTKVEADANKYSFTWRKAVEKFHPKLKDKIIAVYEELIEAKVIDAMAQDYLTSSDGLAEMLAQTETEIEILDTAIQNEPKVIKGGSKKKRQRRRLKSLVHTITTDYLPRARKYEEAEKIFGDRNSFSKTDHDATFMRLKEDPMMNGQLKPAYNLQVASNGQFVLGYDIYPNPTDTRTLIPFISGLPFLSRFKYLVADAGYGSEANYSSIIDKFDLIPLIPYGTYEKEQQRKFKNDPTKVQNWAYNAEDDYYTDYQGVTFSFKGYSIRHDKYHFERQFKVYEADKIQATEELDKLAKTPKGYQRKVNYNPNWDYFKNYVKEQLSSEIGAEIYGHRKIDVEPIFGRMKAIFGVRRIHLRGQDAVRNELGILLMAMNLTKLAKRLAKASRQKQKTIKNRIEILKYQRISILFLLRG